MSKGLVGKLTGLACAILDDCAAYHPDASLGFGRDKTRIMSLSSNHGLSLYTIILPALGAHLDHALELGRLLRTQLPLTRQVGPENMVPRLFQGLWVRLFDEYGCLRQDIDSNDVALLRSICYFAKKYRLKCSDSNLFRTVKDFYYVDQSLPKSDPLWDSDGSSLLRWDLGSFKDRGFYDGEAESLFRDEQGPDSELLTLAQDCADRVAWVIGDYVPGDYGFKHGPGATSEFRRGESYKFDFPSWSDRLQRIFPADVFGVPNTPLLGDGWSDGMVFPGLETHSRLIAVPKTQKGPRLIAAEPTCHQWCQQNIRDFLNVRIRETWLTNSIDFSRQDLSGELARRSSHDGSLATLDLKEASDRLSTWVVQRMFRKNKPVLEALIATRTRYVYSDLDKTKPTLYKLRKFASMGSALTFPIQSLVFLTLCLAAGCKAEHRCASDRTLKELSRRVQVYGDDLIVPVSWVPHVQQILSDLFLKVNDRKSYWNGKFRESCGTDAFDGHVVSPTYVREVYDESKPSTLISIVDTCNNLFRNGLWQASAYLWSTVPERIRRLVPMVRVGSGVFGLESCSGFEYNGRIRWNTSLHRWEALSFRLKTVARETQRHEGTSNLLEFFTRARLRDGWCPHLTEDPIVTGQFGVPEQKLMLGWVPVEA